MNSGQYGSILIVKAAASRQNEESQIGAYANLLIIFKHPYPVNIFNRPLDDTQTKCRFNMRKV